jgi:hypothetical protein
MKLNDSVLRLTRVTVLAMGTTVIVQQPSTSAQEVSACAACWSSNLCVGDQQAGYGGCSIENNQCVPVGDYCFSN